MSEFVHKTELWCKRAERAAAEPGAALNPAWLEWIRDGILLRRRFDRHEPHSPLRRRLVVALSGLQNVCHHRLAAAEPAQVAALALPDRLAGQIAEDHRYLAEVLDAEPAAAARAAEAFRDDVAWSGTLVAVCDGGTGADLLGRILQEQETLAHRIGECDGAAEAARGGPPPADQSALCATAAALRRKVLRKQVETLLNQWEPADWQGWHCVWRAAGRLLPAVRLELQQASKGEKEAFARHEAALVEFRAHARQQWRAAVEALAPDDRREALAAVAEDLGASASEAVTFADDVPLAQAVWSLEALGEDVADYRAAAAEAGPDSAPLAAAMGRRQRRLAGELQERRLTWRMEGLFGPRFVAFLERSILGLLVFFVIMLLAEGPLLRWEQLRRPGDTTVAAAFAWIDLLICVVFLSEFTLKFTLAQPKWLYFRRSWITGLLPAIPAGFIAYAADHADWTAAGGALILLRGLRYLRLPWLVRWLRLARPLIRFVRVLGFLFQASDRLVRQLAPVLNRNVVLFERGAIRIVEPVYRSEYAALRERFHCRAPELPAVLPAAERRRVLAERLEELTAMLEAPLDVVGPAAGRSQAAALREIPLETAIARLLAVTPATVADRVSPALAESVTRWCQAMDVFLIRRLPLFRHLAAAARLESPYETTAAVANRCGSVLRRLLDRLYWFADLYGTVTAPQMVDSIGEWMVKSTARPAKRLLLIGVGFLLVSYLASLLPALGQLAHALERLVGAPLVVLGLICLVPLVLGTWFRQIAGEATDFLGQVAEAQFLSATRQLKARLEPAHRAMMHDRVLLPERLLAGGAWATAAGPAGDEAPPPNHLASEALVERLFADFLEGAPFHPSDTKATVQLLGNVALVSIRRTRLRYSRQRRRGLRSLDLTSGRGSLFGPYLWFHFISRSLAQQTAKLVIDYNAHALPLSRAETACDDDVVRYLAWLSRRLEKPVEQLDLPPPWAARRARLDRTIDPWHQIGEDLRERGFHGNDFTAVHFLSADAALGDEVGRRYGPHLAVLLARDRRDNVRRVFRTYPFHRLPGEQRTINPLALYQRHMEGGRVLLVPFKLAWLTARLAWQALGKLAAVVRDVVNPTAGELVVLHEADPFAVAVRKIHRMRKPLFMECLRMRAEFDPEYLGVHIPGVPVDVRAASVPCVERDLALADADPAVFEEFRSAERQRQQQVLQFRLWLGRLRLGSLKPEALRAAAIAYVIDYRQARRVLEATYRLERALAEVQAADGSPAQGRLSGWLVTLCTRALYGSRLRRVFAQPAFADIDDRRRRRGTWLVCHRRGPLLEAVRCLSRSATCRSPEAPQDEPEDDPVGRARAVLAEVAGDPETWTRQLVNLRAVQTLSVLDMATYIDLVAELGEYENP